MPDRSADWLAQARRDLASARDQADHGYYEWACFIAQQAAEKALKAVYQRLGGEAWGHALTRLVEGLRERLEIPEEVARAARNLDRFYIPTRCPNAWDEGAPKDYFGAEDAADALAGAEAILRFCDRVLAGPGGRGA